RRNQLSGAGTRSSPQPLHPGNPGRPPNRRHGQRRPRLPNTRRRKRLPLPDPDPDQPTVAWTIDGSYTIPRYPDQGHLSEPGGADGGLAPRAFGLDRRHDLERVDQDAFACVRVADDDAAPVGGTRGPLHESCSLDRSRKLARRLAECADSCGEGRDRGAFGVEVAELLTAARLTPDAFRSSPLLDLAPPAPGERLVERGQVAVGKTPPGGVRYSPRVGDGVAVQTVQERSHAADPAGRCPGRAAGPRGHLAQAPRTSGEAAGSALRTLGELEGRGARRHPASDARERRALRARRLGARTR